MVKFPLLDTHSLLVLDASTGPVYFWLAEFKQNPGNASGFGSLGRRSEYRSCI